MDPNAAVETLAPEGVEMTENQAMDAVWDRLHNESTDEVDNGVAELNGDATEIGAESDQSDTGAEPDSNSAPEIEIPSDIPGPLKDEWGGLSERAREAVLTSHRDMAQKANDAGRLKQALGPLHGAVQQAVQVVPAIADMTPEQIAHQFTTLMQTGQELQRNPIAGLQKLARLHNVDLAQMAGQQPNQANQIIGQLNQEIQQLKQQIQASPQQMEKILNERQINGDVQEFAAGQEHWGAVEQHIPKLIPLAQDKLGATAAPKAVLETAYSMAVELFVPNARASEKTTGDEPVVADPERAKAVIRAKSVNVQGNPGTKARPQTDDELMDAVWEKLHGT